MNGRAELWTIALTLALLVIAASIMQGFITTVLEALTYGRIEKAVNSRPHPPRLHVLKAEEIIALNAIKQVNEFLGSEPVNESLKINLNTLISLAKSYLAKEDFGDALSSSLKALAEAWAWRAARMFKLNGSDSLVSHYTIKYKELLGEIKDLNSTVFNECLRNHSLGYIVSDLAYAQFFTDYSWRVLEAGNYSLKLLSAGNGSITDAMIVARAYILSKELLNLAKICASNPDNGIGQRVNASAVLRRLLKMVSRSIREAYKDVQPFSIGARLVDYASSLAQSASDAASHGRYAVADYYALMAYAYSLAADRLANSLYESSYFNTTISADAVLAKRLDLINAYVNAYRVNSSVTGMVLLNSWSDVALGDRSMVNCVNSFCLHFSRLPLTSSSIVSAYVYYARGAALARVAANLTSLISGG